MILACADVHDDVTGPGEFPTQRPMTRSCDVFFDLRLNKRLSKPGLGSIPELELELIPIPIPIPGIGIEKELNKRNWNWNW